MNLRLRNLPIGCLLYVPWPFLTSPSLGLLAIEDNDSKFLIGCHDG